MQEFDDEPALCGGPVALAAVLKPIVARVVARMRPEREAAAVVAAIFEAQPFSGRA